MIVGCAAHSVETHVVELRDAATHGFDRHVQRPPYRSGCLAEVMFWFWRFDHQTHDCRGNTETMLRTCFWIFCSGATMPTKLQTSLQLFNICCSSAVFVPLPFDHGRSSLLRNSLLSYSILSTNTQKHQFLESYVHHIFAFAFIG